MQRSTKNSSLKAMQAIKENSTKKNFDSEKVPPSNGTKRHSSPSGCPPPNPKRKAIVDITNSLQEGVLTTQKGSKKSPLPLLSRNQGTQVYTSAIQPLEDEHTPNYKDAKMTLIKKTGKDVFPTVDQFADALSSEPHWYNLGIFLQLPSHELNRIGLEYRSEGTLRCLIEVYNSLESLNKVPSWELLSQALRRSNNIALADDIYTNYVLKPLARKPPSLSSEPSSKGMSVSDKDDSMEIPSVDVSKKITRQFQQLFERFSVLVVDIIDAFQSSNDVNINNLQQLLLVRYSITPLSPADATIDSIFLQLRPYYCLLNYRALTFLTKMFLKEHGPLKRRLSEYKARVNAFKNSFIMKKMMRVLHKRQVAAPSGCKIVKLTVREFWDNITLKSFETVIKEIMSIVYKNGSQIEVCKGCIAISWIVPAKYANKLNVVVQDGVFQIIGILSLHIDDEVIYDYQGEGCETIEAAMLQAIELKNTRAIELLLAMGCNPEVATYTGDNAVTTIVNIRESKKSSVDHVCIIGHNEHVEAIVDPTSKPAECSSCKMTKQLLQQMESSQEMMRAKVSENELLKNKLFQLEAKMNNEGEKVNTPLDLDEQTFVELKKKTRKKTSKKRIALFEKSKKNHGYNLRPSSHRKRNLSTAERCYVIK